MDQWVDMLEYVGCDYSSMHLLIEMTMSINFSCWDNPFPDNATGLFIQYNMCMASSLQNNISDLKTIYIYMVIYTLSWCLQGIIWLISTSLRNMSLHYMYDGLVVSSKAIQLYGIILKCYGIWIFLNLSRYDIWAQSAITNGTVFNTHVSLQYVMVDLYTFHIFSASMSQ